MKLKESLFDDVDLESIGITNLIISQINKKWDSISDLNSIMSTLTEYNFSQYIPVIQDIIEDETSDIGKLQNIISSESPEIDDNIEDGKSEAEDILQDSENSEITEGLSNNADLIYSWLENNWHSSKSGGKQGFENYISKLMKSGYNTTNIKKDVGTAVKKFAKETKIKPQKIMPDFETLPIKESLRNKKNIDKNIKLKKKVEAVESLQEDIDTDETPTYYASYYEEYPIETDEGMKAGCELLSYIAYDTEDDAINEIAQQAADDPDMEKITDEFYVAKSRYIGNDRFYIVETQLGSENYDPTQIEEEEQII